MAVYYGPNENQEAIDNIDKQISEIENQIYKWRQLQDELFKKREQYVPKSINNPEFGPRRGGKPWLK